MGSVAIRDLRETMGHEMLNEEILWGAFPMKYLQLSRKRFGAGLENMVRHWEADSALVIEQLHTALDLGDWQRLLERAHHLAGGAGVMGAVEVAEEAQALETLARREISRNAVSGSSAERLLHRLEQARERFLDEFSRESIL